MARQKKSDWPPRTTPHETATYLMLMGIKASLDQILAELRALRSAVRPELKT